MNIEVFADIWCPFAHVGLRAVDEQRRLHKRADVGMVVRAWPLELINGTPMDPAGARQHADELRDQVALDLFQDLDVTHFPTSTLDALALVARAYGISVERGERASFTLRDALFERGEDISDPTILQMIADRLDVELPDDTDRATVRRDWEDGRRRGVLGSPHFFCGEENILCPSLSISKTPEAGLSITRSPLELLAFLDHCFASSDSGR